PRHRGEGSEGRRVLRLPLVELLEGVGVRGADRAQMGGGAVAQGDVRLPVRRIGRFAAFLAAGAPAPRAQSVPSVRHGPILTAKGAGVTGVTSLTGPGVPGSWPGMGRECVQ